VSGKGLERGFYNYFTPEEDSKNESTGEYCGYDGNISTRMFKLVDKSAYPKYTGCFKTILSDIKIVQSYKQVTKQKCFSLAK
jgi:hypothetical protein